jgi:hypothetical protein
MVHLTGGLLIWANLERPVCRVHFRVFRIECWARVDRRRHLPQERLLGLPGEPSLRRLCRTRSRRTELGHRKWRADTDDRVRERERHWLELGTCWSECCVARQDPAPRSALLRCDEPFSVLPPITGLLVMFSLMWIRDGSAFMDGCCIFSGSILRLDDAIRANCHPFIHVFSHILTIFTM